ncbi:hypothetical protein [Bythopirellula polymerisocia]|uniref:hypothetical protein n=1 Tax=Bythopirellula polymerisocia TaxID=2528003 RepID=UPI0018D33C64|nr:hypothetical protein [Bythopirellula polymerisocia]
MRHENNNRTIAFVTDVGNDLAYEAPAEAVLEWVTACVVRLQSHQAQVVLTSLPITPLERLSQMRFRVLRGLLFPKCRLKLVDFLERAQELNEGLLKLAGSRKITIFTVPNAWYGLDPIHPRRRFLTQMWRELFVLSDASLPVSLKPEFSLPLALYLRCLSAPNNHSKARDESHSFKRVKLFDGTRIMLY